MTFNLKGYVDQIFTFMVKIKKKKHLMQQILKKISVSVKKMQHNTYDALFSAFKDTFVMKDIICFTDIFTYKQFSCQNS